MTPRQGNISVAVAKAIGDACLATDDIARTLPETPRKQVNETLGRLVMRGFAERTERGCFRLTQAGKSELAARQPFRPGPRGKRTRPMGPKSNRLRQRAWNAMRIKKRFTMDDLVTLAARGGEKEPKSNLRRYCKSLLLAGYLSTRAERSLAGQAPSSNGLIVYRLEKDTGEIAPAVAQDSQSIFDHNSKERVPCKKPA